MTGFFAANSLSIFLNSFGRIYTARDRRQRRFQRLDHSEWQKQFHVRLAKTIATIIVKRGSENK
jgi:hypothetical protein